MDNKTAAVSLVLVAVLGVLAGFYFDNPDTIVEKEYITEYVNNTCGITICEPTTHNLIDDALAEFLYEYEDDDRVRCDGDEYDFEELTVRKVYDEYSVSYDDEDKTIEFKTKLKYNDGNDKCYKTFDVEVFYEEGEDPEVSY